jgi:phage N-6-adenine-methyltransferase
MASFAGKFESVRQDWTTPPELFEEINRQFHFTVDVAASADNTKCRRFFSEQDDAMTQAWGPETCWLNPPYGAGYRLSAWVEKAYKESLNGSTVVMLIPARTNTNWFHDLCLKYGEVQFVRGRPKFGGADHGLPQPLCFVIFRPQGASA